MGHEDDDDQDEGERVPPRGLLYLFLDDVGAFFGHKANVTEGLHYNHCINLEIFWPQTLRYKKVQKGLVFTYASSSTLNPCHSLTQQSNKALCFASWLGFRALFLCGSFSVTEVWGVGTLMKVPPKQDKDVSFGNLHSTACTPKTVSKRFEVIASF